MNTVLINIAIIVGALIICAGNAYFEERELNEINQKIEEEKKYHEDYVNKVRARRNTESKHPNSGQTES